MINFRVSVTVIQADEQQPVKSDEKLKSLKPE
jgi:hypothetical protein